MPAILSCTDGSVYAPSIYDHTAWAAQRMGAEVRVLHMLDPQREHPLNTDLTGVIGIDAQQHLTDELVALEETKARVAQTKARAIIATAREHLARAGLPAIQADTRHGVLVDSIEEFEASADLVVIGKRGEHADFAKLHLGGTLQRVIRSCRHPVLVASRAFQPITKMLIAYDGGPSAKKAVTYAVEQPLLKGLHCHLLMVGGAPDEALAAGLTSARDRLVAAGYTVQADHLPGLPEDVIGEIVQREQINLLVMGAYGHSRIRHLILGSTTTAMVRTCHVPVLMFR